MQKNRKKSIAPLGFALSVSALLLTVSVLSGYEIDSRTAQVPLSAILTLSPWGLLRLFPAVDPALLRIFTTPAINFRQGFFSHGILALVDLLLLVTAFAALRHLKRLKNKPA